jgi:uncharacterized membrane protein
MNILNSILYFLHVLAVVFWIGGIGYILFVLMPAVPHIALRDRARFMPLILRRFLVIVWTAIGVLILSGLYRMFFVWDVTQAGFFTTPTGYTLTIKLVLVAVLIAVAGVVTFQAVPRARAHVTTHHGDPPEAYTCAQCGDIVGGLRRLLQIALLVALTTIYAAVELRGV